MELLKNVLEWVSKSNTMLIADACDANKGDIIDKVRRFFIVWFVVSFRTKEVT